MVPSLSTEFHGPSLPCRAAGVWCHDPRYLDRCNEGKAGAKGVETTPPPRCLGTGIDIRYVNTSSAQGSSGVISLHRGPWLGMDLSEGPPQTPPARPVRPRGIHLTFLRFTTGLTPGPVWGRYFPPGVSLVPLNGYPFPLRWERDKNKVKIPTQALLPPTVEVETRTSDDDLNSERGESRLRYSWSRNYIGGPRDVRGRVVGRDARRVGRYLLVCSASNRPFHRAGE